MTHPLHRAAGATGGAASPVRQDSLRAHNLTLIFERIVGARVAPVSRAHLAATTGLARPTVSRIVEDLLAAGLIVEAGPDRSRSTGRPPVGLALSRTGPAGLGLDVRVDSVTACVVDLTGAVRHLGFAPRPRDGGPEGTIDALAAMAKEAIRAAAAEDLAVVGVTLAAPGPVRDRSTVRFAAGLGWRDVDAGSALRAAIGDGDLPVAVDSEASLAALAELHATEQDSRDFVCVFGDFDLGAGIVLGGVPVRGDRGWTGRLGHVTVDPDGEPCGCGATGCLQRYAGLDAILAAAPEADRAAAAAAHQTPAVTIGALADAGSPQVLTALDRAGTALGIAISTLINLIEVDTVLLDGSYSLLAGWLTGNVQAELARRVSTAGREPVEVRAATLGPDAAAIGAALTAIDEVRRDPVSWLDRIKRT